MIDGRFRDGAPINVLGEALDELRDALRGVRHVNFTGESRDVIVYAAELLGSSKRSSLRFVFSEHYF